jgi:gluconolactonase
VDAVKGVWKRNPVEVHAGAKKNEISPKAHGTFDDSKWEVVDDPSMLKKGFGPGKFSIYWCRINITVPEKVNGKDVAGSQVWFRTTVDDYGEVWVNGKIDSSFGKSGRGAVSGFNTANEVKLSDSAKPGESIQIAVFAINSPFGNPPGNTVFFRNADLKFIQPK